MPLTSFAGSKLKFGRFKSSKEVTHPADNQSTYTPFVGCISQAHVSCAVCVFIQRRVGAWQTY